MCAIVFDAISVFFVAFRIVNTASTANESTTVRDIFSSEAMNTTTILPTSDLGYIAYCNSSLCQWQKLQKSRCLLFVTDVHIKKRFPINGYNITDT